MVADIISAALMLAGALACLMGALGLVRLPDLPARLQATTKPQTQGLLLILLGVAIRLDFESSSTLVLVVLIQVMTAPVISQVVGRAAYRSGAIERESLVVDDLAVQMDADARAARVAETSGRVAAESARAARPGDTRTDGAEPAASGGPEPGGPADPPDRPDDGPAGPGIRDTGNGSAPRAGSGPSHDGGRDVSRGRR